MLDLFILLVVGISYLYLCNNNQPLGFYAASNIQRQVQIAFIAIRLPQAEKTNLEKPQLPKLYLSLQRL